MSMNKDFDCVQAKWDIQQKLREQFENMSPEQARQAGRQRIEADPILGPFAKRMRLTGTRARRK